MPDYLLDRFIRTQDKFAGFDSLTRPWLKRNATPFNMGIVQPILEAKGITSFWQFTKFHTVDDRDLRQVTVTLASLLQNRFEAFIISRVNR